jgi:hypothetical protein
LADSATDLTRSDGLSRTRSERPDPIPRCLDDYANWDAFARLCSDLVPAHHTLVGTAGAIDLVIRRQFRLRRYGVPLGTGPLEQVLTRLRGQIAARAQGLGNLRRTNLLLDLLRQGHNGRADVESFALRVRAELEERRGRPAPVRHIAFAKGSPDF